MKLNNIKFNQEDDIDHRSRKVERVRLESPWKEKDDHLEATVYFMSETVCNGGLKTWDEILKTAHLWENRPVTFEHPETIVIKDPADIVGSLVDVEVIEEEHRLKGKIHLMKKPAEFNEHGEAWWKVMIEAFKERDNISVGYYCQDPNESGTFEDMFGNKMEYFEKHIQILPDHLASVDKGACSPGQGCYVGEEDEADGFNEDKEPEEVDEVVNRQTFDNYEIWYPRYTGTAEERAWSPSPMKDYEEDEVEDIASYFMGCRGRWPPEKFGDLIHGCVFPNGDLSLRALRTLRGSRGVLGLKPAASKAMIDEVYRRTAHLAKKEFGRDWATSYDEEAENMENEEISKLKNVIEKLSEGVNRFVDKITQYEDGDVEQQETVEMDKEENTEDTTGEPEEPVEDDCECTHEDELQEKDITIESLREQVENLEKEIADYKEVELERLREKARDLTTVEDDHLAEMDEDRLSALIEGAVASKPKEEGGQNLRSPPGNEDTDEPVCIDLYKHPLDKE